jgi:hypothetical protein
MAPTAAAADRDGHEPTIRLQLVEDDRGSLPKGLAEEWSGAPPRFTVRFGQLLESTADVADGTIEGWVCASLLREQPETAGRLLVEGPLAAVRSGHGWQVVHGATVIGSAGAVVIRGASDSGKSTLAAAACRAGLEILGDESLLAGRPSHEEIVATVREVLVRPTVGEMLGLEGEPVVTSGGESKLRLALPPLPVSKRSSVHAATVLLGDKDRTGGARLTPLEAGELETGFSAGEIPQERWYGASPEPLARHWARRPAYRLDGSVDLEGAVALLGRLARGESV